MSKHYNFQKILFGENSFDDDFNKIKTTPDRISDDDNFDYGKKYRISNILNDILYRSVTCNAPKTCLFKFK